MGKKLTKRFFRRDALEVAPELLGKYLVRRFEDGSIGRFRITDVEAYLGMEDKASHASKGKTKRTEVLFREGGCIYVYFIYGMYWLLNITVGKKDQPEGIMIRGLEGIDGPGRVGKCLKLDRSLYGKSITGNDLWVEDADESPPYTAIPRIGVDYAEEWKDAALRYRIDG